MQRTPSKLSLENMALGMRKGLAGDVNQQLDLRCLLETKRNILTLLHRYPRGIELDKFVAAYQHVFRKEVIPEEFGYRGVADMLRSLHHIVDLRHKVKLRKVLFSKYHRGSSTGGWSGTKQEPLMLIKERVQRVLMGYPNGLYAENLNQAYFMKYREWISPTNLGFSGMGKLVDSFQDVLEIKWVQPEEGKWIVHLKSTGGDGNVKQERKEMETQSMTPLPVKQGMNKTSTPTPPVKQAMDKTCTPTPPVKQGMDKTSTPTPPVKEGMDKTSTPTPPVKQGIDKTCTPTPPVKQGMDKISTPTPPVKQGKDKTSMPTPPVKQAKDKTSTPPLPVEQEMEKPPSKTKLQEVVEMVLYIVKQLQGIELDSIIPEYESRTGKKLDLQELGFTSLPAFLNHMAGDLKVMKYRGRVIIVEPDMALNLPSETPEPQDTAEDEAELKSEIKAAENLQQLLQEDFPYGLKLEELSGAYKGLYGTGVEELNYEKYGYRTLEAYLTARPKIATVVNCQNAVHILPPTPLETITPEHINTSYTGAVVKEGERFPVLEDLTPGCLDVIVGDVYTPHFFWVMRYGEGYSFDLDTLMDNMIVFYSSPLSERYRVQEGKVSHQRPLVALYMNDRNFYRAIVLSVEDLKTVKVLFVDYGTIYNCPYDCLRLMHRRFFDLPAQAIKCALYNVTPPKKKSRWPIKISNEFLRMVENQKMKAEVMDMQGGTKTILQLWDTSKGEEVNIAELLVSEGMAMWVNPSDHSTSPCRSELAVKPDSPMESSIANMTNTTREPEESSSDMMDFEAGGATAEGDDDYRFSTSTPEPAVPEPQDSYRLRWLEFNILGTIKTMEIRGVLCVMDSDLPHVWLDQVKHLGVTFTKEDDPELYLFMVESGFEIFEPSGKLRPSIVVYPFSALPQILTLGVGNNHVKEEEETDQETSISVLLKEWDCNHASETQGDSSTSSRMENEEHRNFYRHGAQVQPLRRPYISCKPDQE